MEHLPRQGKFLGCISLQVGSFIGGLLSIAYSLFALSQCIPSLKVLPLDVKFTDFMANVMLLLIIITHSVTIALTCIMLSAVCKGEPKMIKPYIVWTSVQVMLSLLLFVLFTTMSMINHFQDTSLAAYVIDFVVLVIRFYVLIVVTSYYKHLIEQSGENKRLNENEVRYN